MTLATAAAVVAKVDWGDIASVIGWGLLAGVGLTVVFSFAIRGFALGAAARRDGDSGRATLHMAIGFVCAVVCIVAVVAALATMLHR